MDTFQAHYTDIRDPSQQLSITARLRDQGLVTFDGLGDRAALVTVARRLMTIRPHRDADRDGITVITGTGAKTSGYSSKKQSSSSTPRTPYRRYAPTCNPPSTA